ncbi:hypothetical protein BH18PSE1_BH18PSE1_07760 [soil metagenome]
MEYVDPGVVKQTALKAFDVPAYANVPKLWIPDLASYQGRRESIEGVWRLPGVDVEKGKSFEEILELLPRQARADGENLE